MTSNKNEKLFGTFSEMAETDVGSTKEIYEKPALTVVNFMFESDITQGSFTDDVSHENDTDLSTGGNWWD